MKQISAALGQVSLSAFLIMVSAVQGQPTGSIVGWGQQVVLEQSTLDDFVTVATGYRYSLGLKADGGIVARGYNLFGRCFPRFSNRHFSAIAAGAHHSLALRGPIPDPTLDPAPQSIPGSGCGAYTPRVPLAPAVASAWLGAPRPTPLRHTTSLGFTLPEPQPVRLKIYDVEGRMVRTLVDETRPAGPYAVVWNARSDTVASVMPGVYSLHLEAGEFRASRKIVVSP